jgi:hypothetical protein
MYPGAHLRLRRRVGSGTDLLGIPGANERIIPIKINLLPWFIHL